MQSHPSITIDEMQEELRLDFMNDSDDDTVCEAGPVQLPLCRHARRAPNADDVVVDLTRDAPSRRRAPNAGDVVVDLTDDAADQVLASIGDHVAPDVAPVFSFHPDPVVTFPVRGPLMPEDRVFTYPSPYALLNII